MKIPEGADLELLAYDISTAIDKGGWDMDISAEDLVPYLHTFLSKAILHSERNQ